MLAMPEVFSNHPPEISEDGSVNIACHSKWSELAWLSNPWEVTQSLIAEGKTTLAMDVSIQNANFEDHSLRFAALERNELLIWPNGVIEIGLIAIAV